MSVPAGRRPGHVFDVQLQVMWTRLLSIVEEQAQALIHTAFSPITRECGDISAGIFDPDGRMLAQSVTGTPGHVNTMAAAVANILTAHPATTMRPGDVYAMNDPWLSTGHLNDVLLVAPVFRAGRVVAFTSCTSHLYDVGGVGMGPNGRDVFDEGLFIPPMKLLDAGQMNESLMTLIKANSRSPVANEGDLYALLACCEVGQRRLGEMMEDFGLGDDLSHLAGHILKTSEQASISAIQALPNGNYRNEMSVDGYENEVVLRAALTVRDGQIDLDFAGTSPCSEHGINVPVNYTAAYSVFALRCVIGGSIPNNAGSLAPFRVSAPAGCILNAPRPAPVAMRHTIGHFVADLALGCLADILPGQIPAESASCMWDIPIRNGRLAGQEAGTTGFAIELTHNGGTGAAPGRDGLSATAFPNGVWGSQAEVTESMVPVRILRRELRPDSGGAGRFRGGLGQVIELESSEQAPILLLSSVDRIRHPARGRNGGQPGACGEMLLGSGRVLPGKGEHIITPGDRLIFRTPGGGGHGNPRDRDPALVMNDVADGLVSPAIASTDYGLVFDAARPNQTHHPAHDGQRQPDVKHKENCHEPAEGSY
jgi:N-methylhydantoinase B